MCAYLRTINCRLRAVWSPDLTKKQSVNYILYCTYAVIAKICKNPHRQNKTKQNKQNRPTSPTKLVPLCRSALSLVRAIQMEENSVKNRTNLNNRTYSTYSTMTIKTTNQFLAFLGTSQDFATQTVVTVVLTLLSYNILFGNRHRRKRQKLAKELDVAKKQLTFLEEKLREPTQPNKDGEEEKEIRIFMEGAFDLMHFGHMNAFRLGRSLGTTLVVGINSDESITECKAAPLMNNEERLAMVQSCKFVDEVVENIPYIMNKEYIDWIFKTYNVDYIIHGDDPCIVDGRDVYETAKQAGKFRTIPRTEGVSTTDILGRMLLLTKEHHMKAGSAGVLGSQSRFLTTTRLLQLFSANVKSPTVDMRVIYIDGAWDMFHPGHVAILKAVKERGDYLIVGIHGDACVNKIRGMNLPLLNLHERVLSVLGCRFVDDVLIDAPSKISSEMIASLRIAEVIHGTCDEDDNYCSDKDERYKYAKEMGIFHVVKNPSTFRLKTIFERIRKNQETFTTRFERKMNSETQHYKQKYRDNSISQIEN